MQCERVEREGFKETLSIEENIQDMSLKGKRGITTSLKRSSIAVVLTKKRSNDHFKKDHNIFVLLYDWMGVREERSSKEIATLILLGIMLLLFIISLTGFVIMWFTEYYNNTILSQIILVNNSESAQSWIDPNPKYDTLLKVHVFNYTNIDRYLSGVDSKIRVVDVGPLTYKEHTKKVNVTFNSNHTVTFRDHRSYKFLPEKSTCDQYAKFILPNVPLLTAAAKIENMGSFKRFAAIQLINSFNEDVFKTLTARDFLWGYRDRIVSLDFGTGSSHFGLLMNRNGSSVDSLQINTGEDDIKKFSIITQFNGMPLLDFWSDDNCNRIDGSDASMFPPHLLENHEDLYVFLQVLCRKIPLRFEKKVTILNNIDALRYRTPMNVFSNPEHNSENQCYCQHTQRCLPSGVINATKCYNGAPIYPSFPHFFSGDPKIYENIEGIEPQKELHQTYADIHPRFAFPISGASRIQINIGVHKTSMIKRRINRIKDGTILPLIWIEITTGDYTEDIIDKLYISTFGLDAIQYALKYGTLLTCITSFGLIVAAINYLYRKHQEKMQESKCKVAELDALDSLPLSAMSAQSQPH